MALRVKGDISDFESQYYKVLQLRVVEGEEASPLCRAPPPLCFTGLQPEAETNDLDLSSNPSVQCLSGVSVANMGDCAHGPAAHWQGSRAQDLTLQAFSPSSTSSQWAGLLRQLPWQREDGSVVPRTDVTWAAVLVLGVGSLVGAPGEGLRLWS